jgi:glycolate oxidase
VRSGQGFFIGDVTVPRQHIPEMQQAIQDAAARHRDGLLFIAVTGHAGDGDLHPTSFFDRTNPKAPAALHAANMEIIDVALGLGGTITGEHGVGTEKRAFMTKRFTPVEIAAQRAIKTAFDPAGVLNPGIMLPDLSPDEPTADAFSTAVRTALTGALTSHETASQAGKLTAGGSDVTVNIANLSLIVGAEATLADITHQLDHHGVACAAIPTTDTGRTIGDLVATAAGTERHHVRNNLLGVDVTLPDVTLPGSQAVARFGGENMKDVAGYDTKRLYIGGHGAFGALTTLIFKITVGA